jgi:hypothetical protein
VADDRDYGTQGNPQKDEGAERGQGGTQSGQEGDRSQQDKENDERSQRAGSGQEGDRDTGTRDRGVERSDWNYGEPAEENERGSTSREPLSDEEES